MSGFTAEGAEMSKMGQPFWSQAFRKRTVQTKTGEVGRDVYNTDFYPQQYKTSKVFSKELTIVFHLMPTGDWRVSERRQGEQLGTLVLSIGRKPQLLPMRASLQTAWVSV